MEISFPKSEEKILKFWKENNIFEKSVKQRAKARNFVFYEGPPTANGRPGIHHVLARIFKDIICRYKTMRGFRVERKAGWDTHGLPVELEVEKKLGFKSKKDIENYGIAKFNKKCRESVWTYKKEWEKLTERIGFWVDLKNPYVAYETKYIETLWQILKKIWEKNLLFQDFKVVPYCPRCGTPLSSHEVAQGYQKIKEPSIYVKFPIKNPEFKNFSLLVWTTTPWTLPANVAVAVNPEAVYAKIKIGKDCLILAKERINLLEGEYQTLGEVKGKDLVGLNYLPPFDFYSPNYQKDLHAGRQERIWEVLPASFVTLKDGSGLVHIAPAFGEDDMELIKIQNAKSKIQKFPVLLTVDEEGKFNLDIKKWARMFVKEADPLIIEDLKSRGLLFKEEPYEHDYPFCWRCHTPLLYYAKKSWFAATVKVKKDLVANNKKINWVPGHLKDGRFGGWLKEVKDWAISRERYWATPLPVWQCRTCLKTDLIGSINDLVSQKFSQNRYFILRHGESLGNKKKLTTCWPEKVYSPLTKKGEKKIELVAKKLKSLPAGRQEKIDLIFSSDLLRTKQTAGIVAKELGIKPKLDKRLREVNVGIFNGKPVNEMGKFWASEGKIPPLEYYSRRWQIPAPQGEDYKEVEKRMWSFIKETDKKYRDKNILIVSHARPLALLEKILLGQDSAWVIQNIVREKEIKTGELRKLEFKLLPYDEKMELDLHRPYVDEVKFICSKCGGQMQRVPDVLDVWFDSGAMPFAQNPGKFPPKLFPADYVSEAIDQTRGWFYTLLAVSTLLGFGPPFKNVISLGHILDEKGEKMSKSKGNVVDPWYIVGKYGADASRWYFYTVSGPGEAKLFAERDVDQALKKFILTFWNCFIFYKTYTAISANQPKNRRKSASLLDKWIVSRLNQLIFETTKFLDKYDVTGAARAVERFVVDDLSLWYIRRSRKKIQDGSAANVLGSVLLNLAKLTAPFIPFLSEQIYQEIGNRKFLPASQAGEIGNSVHLEGWPKGNRKLVNKDLEKRMEEVRQIVSLALAERAKAGIKVRQPLASLKIQNPKSKIQNSKELLELIKEEVNVKEIVFDDTIAKEVELDVKITPELKEEGIVREIIRHVQEMRKAAGLRPQDQIKIYYSGPASLEELLVEIKDFQKKEKDNQRVNLAKEINIDGENLWIGIRKI